MSVIENTQCSEYTMGEANKTVKVDESVHNELSRLKDQYNVDTFNHVLRHELELVPGTIEKLTGYLPAEFRETVKRAVNEIDSIGDFEKRMTEDPVYGEDFQDTPTLQFRAVKTNKVIAEVTASETGFTVYYLNQDGKMATTGGGLVYSDGRLSYGQGNGDYYDDWEGDDVIELLNRRVAGAYRAWVESQ